MPLALSLWTTVLQGESGGHVFSTPPNLPRFTSSRLTAGELSKVLKRLARAKEKNVEGCDTGLSIQERGTHNFQIEQCDM